MRKPNANRGRGKCINWLREHSTYAGDECVIWPYNRVRGYGLFGHHGEMLYAHREMCRMANGEPPTPQHQAAHSCGRGHDGCCNPRHLSWKTQAENQLDRTEHGTRNVAHWGRVGKLTAEQVAEIRALAGTKTQDEIAKQFGIGRRNVGAILSGKTWRPGARRPLTVAEVLEIRKLYDYLTMDKVGEIFGINAGTVWRIVNGHKTYAEMLETADEIAKSA